MKHQVPQNYLNDDCVKDVFFSRALNRQYVYKVMPNKWDSSQSKSKSECIEYSNRHKDAPVHDPHHLRGEAGINVPLEVSPPDKNI